MRVLACVGVAVISGCTIEVGEGQISPITIAGRLSLPAAEARAGQDGSWVGPGGEALLVRSNETERFLSVTKEVQFFSREASSAFGEELRGKADALQRIDVIVKTCELGLLGVFSAEAVLDGTALGGDGSSGRIELPRRTRDRVVWAVEHSEPLLLSVGVQVHCAREELPELPNIVELRVVLQPVLLIDQLKAL